MLGDERLQLDDELLVASELEIGFDPLLLGCEAQLVEPRDLGLREVRVAELREGRAAPQPERLPQLLGGELGLATSSRSPRLLERVMKDVGVELAALEAKAVSVAVRLERAPAEPSVPRSRETSACSVFSAEEGGVSPQRPSMSLSADTISLAWISRIARSSRCFPPGSRCARPRRRPREGQGSSLPSRSSLVVQPTVADLQPPCNRLAARCCRPTARGGRRRKETRMKRLVVHRGSGGCARARGRRQRGDRPPPTPTTVRPTDRARSRSSSTTMSYAPTTVRRTDRARSQLGRRATPYAPTTAQRTDRARSRSSS